MQSTGASSIRHLAEITGEDWSYLAKIFRILELPEEIRNFLRKNLYPELVKYFHLRCLLEIVRLPKHAQTQRFREICEAIAISAVL